MLYSCNIFICICNILEQTCFFCCITITGVITWAIAIPVDVVKNRYMADGYNFDNRKYRGLLDCISKTYREHGVNVFYKGISIALLRAFPVSLVCFIRSS